MPWICLDSLVRIVTFQGVTGLVRRGIFSLHPPGSLARTQSAKSAPARLVVGRQVLIRGAHDTHNSGILIFCKQLR